MSSKQDLHRNLITLDRQPMQNSIIKNILPHSVKMEPDEIINISSSPTERDIISLTPIKIETGENYCSKSSLVEPVTIKQEPEAELPTIRIKSEFKIENNLNQFNLVTIQPEVSVKKEEQPYISQWKVPKPMLCKLEPDTIKTSYKCCNFKYNDKFQHFYHMLDHMHEELTWRKIKCNYCFRYFKTENDMIRHAKSKHLGFYCMSCSATFAKRHLLMQHLKSFHNYNNHKARFNKKIKYSNILNWHRNAWEKKGKALNDEINRYCMKMNEDIKLKMERTTAHVKVEPNISNVKEEPTIANVKVEPVSVKMELD